MITFKAQYIRPAIIEKRVGRNFQTMDASIVELSPSSIEDFWAINKLNCNWDDCQTLLHDITNIFNGLHHNTKKYKKQQFFALTYQQDSFEKLDETKILGVLQTKKEKYKNFEIENFQVDPDTNFDSTKRTYRKVGKALLDALKEVVSYKTIVLEAERSAILFYEKNGFKLIGKGKDCRMKFRR